jgi:hypothetical protein
MDIHQLMVYGILHKLFQLAKDFTNFLSEQALQTLFGAPVWYFKRERNLVTCQMSQYLNDNFVDR